ncbi:MAG: aromatic ring-hydroxylating dioxygenase subunit alpha [Acidobacteriota bacterium]
MARARLPFAEAAPMPGRVYADDSIAELEAQTLLRQLWVAVGRTDELNRPGQVTVRTVGGESVLLCADAQGVLRAFYNVCRHRGTRLVEGSTDKRSIQATNLQCPYHAWTYGLDGRLVGAPLLKEVTRDPERRCALGLLPVASGSWNGFTFVCLDPQQSLEEQFADAPDVSRFLMDDLRTAARVDYDVAVNWKLLCENYSECYHCALVHPELHRITHYQSGGDQEDGESFVGGPMRLNDGFNTMSVSGMTNRPSIPGLAEEDHAFVYYYVLYPNLWLSLHRDYVLVHLLEPLEAGRTRIECFWLAHPDAIAAPGFVIDDAVQFWDLTNRQDWAICERTQKGVGSTGYLPTLYQDGESCLHAFANWYLKAMDRALEGL